MQHFISAMGRVGLEKDLVAQNPGLGKAARKRIASGVSTPAPISNTSKPLLELL
jgi:hypothetical protein